MSEQEAETATVEAPETEPVVDSPIEGEEALGDPGKRALALMKASLAAEKKEKADLAKRLAELELKSKSAEEQAVEAARAEGRSEVKTNADTKILRSELKALATGKLADPADAALFINLADFTVSDDGDVDSDALSAAIADLITRKPHLAAPAQQRFEGGGDGGAAAPAKPTATLEDQIAAAHAAGDWRKEMSLQNSKLPDPK